MAKRNRMSENTIYDAKSNRKQVLANYHPNLFKTYADLKLIDIQS